MPPHLFDSQENTTPTRTQPTLDSQPHTSPAVQNPVNPQETTAKRPTPLQDDKWSICTDESYEILKPPTIENQHAEAQAKPNLKSVTMARQKKAGFCGFMGNIFCGPDPKKGSLGEKEKLCPHCGEDILVRRKVRRVGGGKGGDRMMNHM
jgi:hypothetical protein